MYVCCSSLPHPHSPSLFKPDQRKDEGEGKHHRSARKREKAVDDETASRRTIYSNEVNVSLSPPAERARF